GSTGSFVLGNADVGLIHYNLQLDPAAGAAGANGQSASAAAPVAYVLTASVGAPVYAALKLAENAQSIWRQSADAWSAHLAAMRGDAWAGGGSSDSGRFWAQAYGSNSDRDQTAAGVAIDYEQRDAGVQIGSDLVRKATRLGDVVWGVTAGYD